MNTPTSSKVECMPWNASSELRIERVLSEINKWDPNEHIMLSGHSGSVWSVTSTSNNRYIFSGSEDKTIIVWNGILNTEHSKLEGHTGTITTLDITPDNKFLISGCLKGLLMIWDWRKGAKIGDFIGHTAEINCSRILKDGKTLFTGSGDFTAKMWNIETRTLKRSFSCEGNSVFCLTLLKKESVLICGGSTGLLRIWENKGPENKPKDVNPNAGVVQALTSTPNSLYVVVGTRNSIIIVYNYPAFTVKTKHTVHKHWVRNLISTEDSRYFFSSSNDHSIRLFNFETDSQCFAIDRDDGFVIGLHLSADGTILYTGTSDKILRKRVIGKKDKVDVLTGHKSCIMSISLSSDSQFVVSAAEDKTIKIWSLTSMALISTLTGHTETVWGVDLTKDMKYILSASGDKTVKVWDFNSYANVATFTNHRSTIYTVASSEYGRYGASGAHDKKIGLYSLTSLKHIHTFEGHTDTIFSVKFTADEEYLCSGAADYTIRIWSVSKFIFVDKIETKAGMVESIALTKDSKYLIIGDRGCFVHLWDFENRKKIKTFTMHTKWIKNVSLSDDDSIVATASNDNKIYIINLNQREIEKSFSVNTSSIRSVGITNDMKYIISGGEDKSIKICSLNDDNDTSNLKINQYGSQFGSLFFLNCIKGEKKPDQFSIHQSISPLRLTLCHIYCYQGHHELLSQALESGAKLKKDAKGCSPLFYALERDSQKLVDTILSYLNELSTSSFNNFLDNCWALRDDFERLLKNRSIYLPEFLDRNFYVSQQQGLAKFGMPVSRLPVIRYKPDLIINVNDFLYSEVDKSSEVLVEFKVLPFPIPTISGSGASIKMLKNIADCPNKLISRANIIQVIVRLRWKNFRFFILLLTFLYWANIGIMIWLLVKDTTNPAALTFYIIVNLILLVYEMVQVYSIGFREYFNFWNMIDLARIAVCIVWIMVSTTAEENNNWLSYIMVAFNFVRGLTGFRAFDRTRFYVRLILRAFIDTIPFIIIFFYTTLFFGMLNWSSGISYRDDSFIGIWKRPFELNMGNFDNSSEPDLNFLYFMLASVINVIIILNLLISILGDTYDRIQAESIEIGNLEMVDLILEIETLMFWRRNRNEKNYIQVCDATSFEGITDEWEGKLNVISDLIKNNGKITKTYFDSLKKKFDSFEDIKKKLDNFEDIKKKLDIFDDIKKKLDSFDDIKKKLDSIEDKMK